LKIYGHVVAAGITTGKLVIEQTDGGRMNC